MPREYKASEVMGILGVISQASAVIAGAYGAGCEVEMRVVGSPRFAELHVGGKHGVLVYVGIPRKKTAIHVGVEGEGPEAELVANALGVELNAEEE